MKPKRCFLALVVTTLTLPAYAQPGPGQKPSPEEVKQMMAATMGAMVPVMGDMTEAMIEAQLKIASKPETAQRIAAFKKNLYDALLKQGFNGLDAMSITIATSTPAAAPSAK